MTMKPRHDFTPCVPGALSGGLSRTEFFDGMVLSEADMKREQSYWQMKRRLTNRALGQGVVWGLTLHWDERSRCFTLCPGYGLSCCGDDLVVECPETVCERDLIDPCSEEFRRLFVDPKNPCADPCEVRPDAPVEACLMLEYVECPEDPRQVFEDPCAELPKGCRFGAVRETTRLRLVPPPPAPPPGPMERFCARIAEIREQLAKAAEASGDAPPPEPLFAGTGPQARITAAPLDANDLATAAYAEPLPAEVGATATITMLGDSSDEVKFTLEPMPGFFFTSFTQDGFDQPVGQILMGFATTASAESLTNGVGIDAVAVIAPLFGTGPSLRVTYRIEAARGDATTITAEVLAVEELPERRDCVSVLEEGLFLDTDPACQVRTMLMAVLCGWFRGQLGTAPCAEGEEEVDPARAAIAWAICWLAWRLVWELDATTDAGKAAEDCLRKLFQEWCAGMHYKGPRCEHNLHGIVLGCVKVHPNGRIECFDEWARRRHVLTGPLLSHWGAQFGLAPLDVAASRLARWICCVAATPAAQMPQLPGEAAALFSFGNGGFLAGQELAAGATLGQATVNSVRPATPLDMIGRVIDLIAGPERMPLSAAPGVDLFTLQGGGLQLAVPRGAPAGLRERAANREAIRVLLAREMAEAPPMARPAMESVLDEVAGTLTAGMLRAPTDSPLFGHMVRAIEAHEADIPSLRALIAMDPERAVDLVRPELRAEDGFTDEAVADKAMGLVYGAAVKTLRDGAGAILEQARAREDDEAFVRADLEEAATVSALRTALNPNLQGRGLTLANIRAIAARAAKRG
ncbi:hypothetical protein ILP92_17075 [Maribius pontilimi]|uniref:Uncharacterized protein n=1 Tax=Palleronia pontilimi TaxID=1964209 RepID=A0A934IF19_9RHOB|nr:hypothetical protein [Palleronia pontilimi]MBJ3764451.1 hypothetical protein [Palleronia pontilimi]